MNDFSLIPYQSDIRLAWDDVVLSSKNGNFLHLRGYMDYHAHRFDEQSTVVLRKGRPVAVFPCNRQEEMLVSHSGLTYGGLIFGTDTHAGDVLNIFGILATHYKNQGVRTLLYKAIPHIFHRYPAEEDLYALFRFNARLVRRDISSVIALGNPIKLSDSRKNTIRKAEKNKVEFAELAELTRFYDLLSNVLGKFGARPVHSLEEIELLRGRFPNNIRLFGAVSEGQLLAGALVYDFGAVVHTQYLASSEEGRKIGALDFLLSVLITNVFSSRCYFSFGISTERNGHFLNDGLIFQKEGFGGRGIVHDWYELEL